MRYSPLLLAPAALLALAASSLWLDFAGQVAPGTVTLKREVIQLEGDSWSRQLLLRVVYHPAGRKPLLAELAASEDDFDRVRLGDTVLVRFANLRIIPGVRLATRNTATIAGEMVHAAWAKVRGPVDSAPGLGARRANAQVVLVGAGIVQVSFVPEDRRDAVSAVIEIRGKVPSAGSDVEILYDPAAPRHARLFR